MLLPRRRRLSMKRKQLLGGAFAEGVLLAAALGAHARTEITCMFSWEENAEANIKGHGQSAATLKKGDNQGIRSADWKA